MEISKLWALVTADTDGAAALDIREDGHIVAASLEVWALSADALNDGLQAEVSFASTSGFAVNDTKASFIHAAAFQGFLTSGGGVVRAQSVITGIAIPVAAGERVHLHIDNTGGISTYALAYLYIMPLAAGGRGSERRIR